MSLTNYRYGTEAAVGKAIRDSGIPRNELFITTKLWNTDHHPDDVAAMLDASLKDLGLDYVDLYVLHWPIAFQRGGKGPFPVNDEGKVIHEDIDYVDVCRDPIISPSNEMLSNRLVI